MIPITVSVIFQALMVIHCIRSGNDRRWLWLIIILPGVGGLAYLFIEVLPNLGQSMTARKTMRRVKKKIDPLGEERRRFEDLERSASVETRRRLAEELLENEKFDEAERLYRQSLKGVFEDDTTLLLGLARALFGQEKNDETIATLDRLIEAHPDFKSQSGHLLYARALEARGDIDKAKKEYEVLSGYFAGPEAKCRYAQLLKRNGDPGRAQALFDEVVKTARLAPRHYRRRHKSWIALAKRGGE